MAEANALVELLRKCHRDELLPLARALGIDPTRMKRATLAQAIDGRLRRSSTHELLNLVLRRGAGPPYSEVLSIVARKAGVSIDPADPEASEDALLRAELAERWADLSPEERKQRWESTGTDEPVPADAEQALNRLELLIGQRYSLTAHAAFMARVLPAPFGCVPMLIAFRPHLDLTKAAVLEVGRLRKAVRYRVTIGVVGSPSSGKDAAMAAVFGMQTGNVNPIAGSTTAVEITKLAGASALYLVNTPGLGDVVESVTEEAKQVLDHIDLYLYVINAQGGVQAREKADHASVLATKRPVLAIVNKIDTIKPEDRERYLKDAQLKLGVSDDGFTFAAFDPLPQLAEAPIGVEPVRRWIEQHLTSLGKELDELPWRRD